MALAGNECLLACAWLRALSTSHVHCRASNALAAHRRSLEAHRRSGLSALVARLPLISYGSISSVIA